MVKRANARKSNSHKYCGYLWLYSAASIVSKSAGSTSGRRRRVADSCRSWTSAIHREWQAGRAASESSASALARWRSEKALCENREWPSWLCRLSSAQHKWCRQRSKVRRWQPQYPGRGKVWDFVGKHWWHRRHRRWLWNGWVQRRWAGRSQIIQQGCAPYASTHNGCRLTRLWLTLKLVWSVGGGHGFDQPTQCANTTKLAPNTFGVNRPKDFNRSSHTTASRSAVNIISDMQPPLRFCCGKLRSYSWIDLAGLWSPQYAGLPSGEGGAAPAFVTCRQA